MGVNEWVNEPIPLSAALVTLSPAGEDVTTEPTRKRLSDGGRGTQPDIMEAGAGWSQDLEPFPSIKAGAASGRREFPKAPPGPLIGICGVCVRDLFFGQDVGS